MFIYNKTIGALVFNKKNQQKTSFKNKFILVKDACMLMQIYIRTIFIIYYNTKNLYNAEDLPNHNVENSIIEEMLENTYDRISNLVYVLYNNNLEQLVETIINNEINILNYSKNSTQKIIPKSINKVHLKLLVLSNLIKKKKKSWIFDNINLFNQKTNVITDEKFYKKREFETNKNVKKIIKELNKSK